MKSKKGFLLTFMLLLLIVVITACGGGGGNEEATDEQAGQEEGGTATEAVDGKAIYENNCMSCHAANGAGGSGPSLQSSTDKAAVVEQIKKGGGGMPAFEGQLSEEEIDAVAQYIIDEIAK